MADRKRTRRADSFCKTSVERTISASLQSHARTVGRRQRQVDGSEDEDVNSHFNTNDHPSNNKDNGNDATTATSTEQQDPETKVTFSDQTPTMYTCSNFDQNMTPLEREQRKAELWYTRTDFEDFLRERIATIHLLKGLGDAVALRRQCPDLCLRGLEPFQATHLNTELQCQRQLHQKTVLAEQLLFKQLLLEQQLQKQSQPQQQELQREHIRAKAEERSQWARQRAQQLASLDALEAQAIHQQEESQESNSLPAGRMQRRTSALAESARLGLEGLNLLGAAAEVESAKQQQEREAVKSHTMIMMNGDGAQQKRLPSPVQGPRRTVLSFAPPQLQLSARRVPVDLAILKEWNAKFLNDMRQKGMPPSTTAATATASSSRVPAAALGIASASPPAAARPLVKLSPSQVGRPTLSSLSSATAQTRLALQKDGLLVGNNTRPTGGFAAMNAPSNTRMVAPIRNTPMTLNVNNSNHGSSSMFKTNDTTTASIANAMLSHEALMRLQISQGLPNMSNIHPAVNSNNNINNFRLPVRRDSLLGTSTFGDGNNGFAAAALADPCFRFDVRRDSLRNVNCS